MINSLGNFLFLVPLFHCHYLIAQSLPPLLIEDLGTWLPVSTSPAFSAIVRHFHVHTDNPSNNPELHHLTTTSFSLPDPEPQTKKLLHGLRLQYLDLWPQLLTTPAFFTPFTHLRPAFLPYFNLYSKHYFPSAKSHYFPPWL